MLFIEKILFCRGRAFYIKCLSLDNVRNTFIQFFNIKSSNIILYIMYINTVYKQIVFYSYLPNGIHNSDFILSKKARKLSGKCKSYEQTIY